MESTSSAVKVFPRKDILGSFLWSVSDLPHGRLLDGPTHLLRLRVAFWQCVHLDLSSTGDCLVLFCSADIEGAKISVLLRNLGDDNGTETLPEPECKYETFSPDGAEISWPWADLSQDIEMKIEIFRDVWETCSTRLNHRYKYY